MDIAVDFIGRRQNFSGLEFAVVNGGTGTHNGLQTSFLSVPELDGEFQNGKGVNVSLLASDIDSYRGVKVTGFGGVGDLAQGVVVGGVFVEHLEMQGLSIGGLASSIGTIHGATFGGVLNLMGNFNVATRLEEGLYGTATSLVANVVKNADANGFLASGGINYISSDGEFRGYLNGMSIAPVNHAKRLRGVQFGAVNSAGDDSYGVQFGILNYCVGRPWYAKFIPGIAIRTGPKKKVAEGTAISEQTNAAQIKAAG